MSNILKGPFFWLCFFVIRYVSKAYITDNKGYVVWTTAIWGLIKEGLGKCYKRIIVEQVEVEEKPQKPERVKLEGVIILCHIENTQKSIKMKFNWT